MVPDIVDWTHTSLEYSMVISKVIKIEISFHAGRIPTLHIYSTLDDRAENCLLVGKCEFGRKDGEIQQKGRRGHGVTDVSLCDTATTIVSVIHTTSVMGWTVSPEKGMLKS